MNIAGWLLLACVSTADGSACVDRPDILSTFYETEQMCLETSRHSSVIASYKWIVKDFETILYCKPIMENACPVK